ncbi:unnamed protein product [Cyprideis torosa]|uniref:Uncharacterized protein n=1 Tax=Cyprideis torosa TaxID=163714 RepID=A0A7R8WC14_9CRUS|nr:unnamed protein product [Cyprideis torosa]CAG0890227.1 unnamed protein product [Cyprideis torosa]
MQMQKVTFSKVWDRSKHVSHMHTHAKEYTDEVVRFMDRVGLISPRDPIAQMFEEEERKQKMATN